MKYINKISVIIGLLVLGIFIIAITFSEYITPIVKHVITFIGVLMIMISIIGAYKKVVLDYRKNLISQINNNMKKLSFSKQEIEERQIYLNNQNEEKLEKIKKTLEFELNAIDDEKFYDPIRSKRQK
ncbi:TPA: hypothetical protein ACF8UL_002602 [Staphylococcus aureus]|uniref:hypothetical protein n=1 Tax=Staphylococcus aureus TaxID=1280 RepID=UPI00191A1C86|nr:hypothetical protein [Staphylococcus aureus]MBL0430461.1 hypothetical protein [Staphylococcus aureus]HDH0857953.1 hypothetical protein [Staphylococcus aureus]HDH5694638.1 hypothetical protein [Staphylococcus aureus]HDH5697378.1 hypothetical protein [Staphylococcus aureus]HDP6026626.1 hypothetical protein [Staphylococcus aureus]